MTVAPIQAHSIRKTEFEGIQENVMSLIIRIMLLANRLSQHSSEKGQGLRDAHKECSKKIAANLNGRPVNLVCASFGIALAASVAFGALHAGGFVASAVYQQAVSPAASTLFQTASGTAQAAFGLLANASQTALGARQDAQKAPLDAELGVLQQRMQDQSNQGQSLGALSQAAEQVAQTIAAMLLTVARGG